MTIAELLKAGGYTTACIGKWHLGFHEPFLPRNQGFDHYFRLLHNLDPVEVIYFEDSSMTWRMTPENPAQRAIEISHASCAAWQSCSRKKCDSTLVQRATYRLTSHLHHLDKMDPAYCFITGE